MAYTDIDDPSEYFTTTLYTGTGATRSVTNTANAGDFRPDWVWIKARSFAESHMLYDSTRGATKDLRSDGSNAENTNTTGLTSFDTNGFSTGSMQNVNKNTSTYVAWQWKANGGTTSSNTDGSITSTVQANTTAGFSIVTYTGTGANTTVGHGLGIKPQFIIVKNRTDGSNWEVYSEALDNTGNTYLSLNGSVGGESDFNMFNDTAPTTSVFSVGTRNETNGSNDNIVAYCFRSIQGYSKFGSYVGNGNANGTFVYTGFKPAWIIVKRTDGGSTGWLIYDTARDTFNEADAVLQAHVTTAEVTAADIDILSNGWKFRTTDVAVNGSGATYIYAAFAESPFVSSEGVPTTAR
jgi:hypothetical protein